MKFWICSAVHSREWFRFGILYPFDWGVPLWRGSSVFPASSSEDGERDVSSSSSSLSLLSIRRRLRLMAQVFPVYKKICQQTVRHRSENPTKFRVVVSHIPLVRFTLPSAQGFQMVFAEIFREAFQTRRDARPEAFPA